MLIKEVFVVLCYYLYIQSLSKIAASVNLNLSNHVRFFVGKHDDCCLQKIKNKAVLYVITLIKVILYSYLILKKMNERITDS